VTLTDVELKAVRELARANDISVADALRLGTLALAAFLENYPSMAPLVLDSGLCVIVPPEARELLPGRKESPSRN